MASVVEKETSAPPRDTSAEAHHDQQEPLDTLEQLPHYALPNFSAVLPAFANHESDTVAAAFRVGNFVSIHDLPAAIAPGHVSRGRFQKMIDNRQPSAPAQYKRSPYFSEFIYLPPAALADELNKSSSAAAASSAAKSDAAGPAWRVAGTSITAKYEDFSGSGFKPFASGADPYGLVESQEVRQRFLQEANILAGPFKPAGKARGQAGESALERPSVINMPEIVAQLRAQIEEDWGDHAFVVCTTDDEHIVVRFELSTVEEEPGLPAYMKIFARTNHVVTKYLLKKAVEDWNVTPGDGFLYYTFRPPWISTSVNETYYALHPEQRSFHGGSSRLSAAERRAMGGAQNSSQLSVASGGGDGTFLTTSGVS